MAAQDQISLAAIPIHNQQCTEEACKEDEVALARAEMSQVREENARLKMLLEKIENDYNFLQMRFTGISQPESSPETKNYTNEANNQDDDKTAPSGVNEEPELAVSLSLGRSSDNNTSSSPTDTKEKQHKRHDHFKKEGDLRLTLDFNSSDDYKSSDPVEDQTSDPSPENSPLEDSKEEEEREAWPPSKAFQATTTRSSPGDDDLSHTGVKRARVSVRSRCDAPTMNDGCQWRKYGQKIAKGNPCPRAYYRCTVAPLCPVRKQVQRCAEDTSILITTYEGIHNHSLPVSATAMASTTSAAASMLLSGASASQFGASRAAASGSSTGLNVNLSDNSRSQPYYLPNSSTTSCPTITLDLTNDPSTTSSQFKMFSSGSFQSIPRLNSTSLNFAPAQPGILSSIWANGNLSYGGSAMPFSKNHMMGSSQPGRTSQEHLYQVPILQKNYQAAAPSQQVLTETLTTAITSDPSFRSVLAAAITTMVGGRSGAANSATQAGNDKLDIGSGNKLKGDNQTMLVTSSNPSGDNGKGCASSFLNQSFATARSGSSRKQQPPQPPFSISAGAAPATAPENADQSNQMLLE